MQEMRPTLTRIIHTGDEVAGMNREERKLSELVRAADTFPLPRFEMTVMSSPPLHNESAALAGSR